MKTAKAIRPAQMLDKDPANLSYMMAAIPPSDFISTFFILGRLLIFEQFRDFRFMEKFS